MVTLDYELMLSVSLWQYNHRPDEGSLSNCSNGLSDRSMDNTITRNGPAISTATYGT